MRLLARLSWVLAVFSIGGCTEVTGPPPNTAPVAITATAWPVGAGLEDVQLCENDTTNCMLTDANGEATLWLQIGEETSITQTKEGHASYLSPFVVPVDGVARETLIRSEEAVGAQYESIMSPYPMASTGTIDIQVRSLIAGAVFDLFDATGKPAGKRFYDDEEDNWSLDLNATTTRGGGGFAEVVPGAYRIQFGGAAEGCVLEWGWPALFHENSVRCPVREGYITRIVVSCPAPP